MPTPQITQSNRHINPGVTLCYFLPTVAASTLVPTRGEMDAGTNVSREIFAITGWSVASSDVQTPDLSSTFVGMIPGRTNAPESSITFYASQNSSDVRTLLPRGTTGYIMWLDGGDVSGQKADVFPVRVKALPKSRTTSEDPATIEVQFSITRQPAENVTIP